MRDFLTHFCLLQLFGLGFLLGLGNESEEVKATLCDKVVEYIVRPDFYAVRGSLLEAHVFE